MMKEPPVVILDVPADVAAIAWEARKPNGFVRLGTHGESGFLYRIADFRDAPSGGRATVWCERSRREEPTDDFPSLDAPGVRKISP